MCVHGNEYILCVSMVNEYILCVSMVNEYILCVSMAMSIYHVCDSVRGMYILVHVSR